MEKDSKIVQVSTISIKLKSGKTVKLSIEEANVVRLELNKLFDAEIKSPDVIKKLEELQKELESGRDRIVPVPYPALPWYQPTVLWMHTRASTEGWETVCRTNGTNLLAIDAVAM